MCYESKELVLQTTIQLIFLG